MKVRLTFVVGCVLCAAAEAPAAEPSGLAELRFFPRPVAVPPAVPEPAGAPNRMADEPADAQDAVTDELVDAIVSRRESVAALEAENGPRAPGLVDELVSLAALYRQAGDHALAIDTLERALAGVRMDRGLYSLEQVPVIEDIIESYAAVDDYAAIAALDDAVLELAFRHPGDARIVSILDRVADRELDAVEHFIEHGPEPQFSINIDVAFGPSPAGKPELGGRRAALASLRDARFLYNGAIQTASWTGGHDVTELFAIEEKIIETLYLEVTRPELYPRFVRSVEQAPLYAYGKAVFEAHLVNSRSHRHTAEAVARALLRLGDWQLLFSRNSTAIDTYRRAYDLLVSEGVDDATVRELLAPAVPVALPETIAPAGDPADAFRGYVDVAFDVSRYGRSHRVDVLGTSTDTPDDVRKRAERLVARSRFRPRFVDGEPARDDRIAVRYYYDY